MSDSTITFTAWTDAAPGTNGASQGGALFDVEVNGTVVNPSEMTINGTAAGATPLITAHDTPALQDKDLVSVTGDFGAITSVSMGLLNGNADLFLETVNINGDAITGSDPSSVTDPTADTVDGAVIIMKEPGTATYAGTPGPVVTGQNGTVEHGTLTPLTTFFSTTDPGVTEFQVSMAPGATGDLVNQNGVAIANGTVESSLANVFYNAPPGAVSDVIRVAASDDGTNFGLATSATVTDLGEPPPVPAGTTADMILSNANGGYEIYDLGNNSILAAGFLGQVGSNFQIAGLGDFNGSDTTDMILRSVSTGAFEVYDISNNNITAAAPLGQVGNDWQVAGFGNFNGPGATDMMLRNTGTGTFELYDINNNSITGANAIGQVGLDWNVAGFGNFNGDDTSDMLLRNSSTGAFEVYDIEQGKLTSASSLGQVGNEWQVAGFGDFNGPGATDMMLRNTLTGTFELYDISDNKITGASAIGQVGLEWQVAGFGAANGAGTSDMILRDTSTGAFEVYDIAQGELTHAQSLGSVGTNWQVAGIAATSPTASSMSAAQLAVENQNAQLVQALASLPNSSGAASTSLSALAQDGGSPLIATNPLNHGSH